MHHLPNTTGFRKSEFIDMQPNHLILFNTLATYANMLIGALLALFSSRWVLASLGAYQFGLFNLIGGMIVFITIINGILSGSSARFMAFAAGNNTLDELNAWFNMSLSIHLFLPLLLIAGGYPIGIYLIANTLNIDATMIDLAIWVFRASALTAFFSMVSVPYVAMFTAQQCLAELSVWSFAQNICIFVLSYSILFISDNTLLVYVFGLALIHIIFCIIKIFRAICIFPACKLKIALFWNRNRFSEMFSFASWSFIGAFSAQIKNQGMAFVLNAFFGTQLNATYGIANSVAVQSGNLSSAMLSSLSPAITSEEGKGNRAMMLAMSLTASRIGSLVVVLFITPIMMEMEYLLTLWLKFPPAYTVFFAQMALLSLLFDKISIGNMMAIGAKGEIKNYQITMGILNFSAIPLAILILLIYKTPYWVAGVLMTTNIFCALARVIWGKIILQISITNWLKKVVFPVIMAYGSGAVCIYPIFHYFPPSPLRLGGVLVLSTSVICLFSWKFVLEAKERNYIMEIGNKIFSRIKTKKKTRNAV